MHGIPGVLGAGHLHIDHRAEGGLAQLLAENPPFVYHGQAVKGAVQHHEWRQIRLDLRNGGGQLPQLGILLRRFIHHFAAQEALVNMAIGMLVVAHHKIVHAVKWDTGLY